MSELHISCIHIAFPQYTSLKISVSNQMLSVPVIGACFSAKYGCSPAIMVQIVHQD